MKRNKSQLVIGLILVIAGGALLTWVVFGRSANAPSSESTGSSQTSSTASSETPAQDASSENPDQSVSSPQNEAATVITFTSNGFTPTALTVKKGTTVTVVNSSSQRVQFSSDDHPSHRLNEGMNLPVLAPGASDSFVADTVGEWGFHDHIDDSFTGVVTVTE